MNKKRTIKAAAILCIVHCALCINLACTNDEVADNNTLPEGKYPLEIGSVSIDGAETRITESSDGMSSSFASGDQISVQIGSGTAGTYKYDGSSFTAVTPAYWQNTNSATVTAWYPTSETIDLSDQSSGLKYVLYATKSNVAYSSSASLSFSHKLAKVRVKFVKSSSYTGNMDVSYVKVKHYTSCTAKNGSVTNGSSKDYITMKENNGYYEANLCPGTLSKTEAISIKVDGTETKVSLSSDLTLTAGKVQTITVTLDETSYTTVNLSSITGSTYTVSGKIHLVGDGSSTAKNLSITVNDGSKLILDNVNIEPTTRVNAITTNGDVTIVLKGTNTICSNTKENNYDYQNDGGIIVSSGTLTINGDDNSSLTADARGASIGLGVGANIVINGGKIYANTKKYSLYHAGIGNASIGTTNSCGIITINGGTIEAYGADYAAGIGCASNEGKCGGIVITGGMVKAYYGGTNEDGDGYPGIGFGTVAPCGDITISGANTVVYAKKSSKAKVASIATGSSYVKGGGTVTIGSECQVTQE